MTYNSSSRQENLLPKSCRQLETNTTWSQLNSSPLGYLRLIPANSAKTYGLILPEIQKLVEEIVAEIDEVERVIAIATSFPDIHWLDFQIKLKADTELSDQTWEKIQDLVIDCEWKLIDDSAEEWYFRPQIVDKLYLHRDAIVADSDHKQGKEVTRPKMWLSNSPKFNVVK
jgi:hypothetical protein